jgi:hypothetical protein
MLRENLVTASLRVDALTQVFLDMNPYNSCVVQYPAPLHYITNSKIKGRRIEGKIR